MSMQKNRTGMLISLVAPSGGGKTTVANAILKHFPNNTKHSVSCTTREPRSNEKDGVHYYFLSEADFKDRILKGLFFEWEEIHGNFYGTLKSTIDDSINSGIDLILDIDIKGAVTIEKTYPKSSLIIFLVPPSTVEWENRLRDRGMGDEEFRVRLETTKQEYQQVLKYHEDGGGFLDYFVLNDNLEDAIKKTLEIVSSERLRFSRFDNDYIRSLCTV